MTPRDIFDLVLVVLVAVALYVQFYGTSTSGLGTVGDIVDAVRDIDPIYYLVVGGVLGVVFVSYITIYLPQKHSRRS